MRVSLNRKRCFNLKSSTNNFHMKMEILADFQICIRVPLMFLLFFIYIFYYELFSYPNFSTLLMYPRIYWMKLAAQQEYSLKTFPPKCFLSNCKFNKKMKSIFKGFDFILIVVLGCC